MADPTHALSNLIWQDDSSVMSVPMAGGETIYEGSLVCYDVGGDATPSDDTGPSIGRAAETVANTTAQGGGSDGDMYIKVARKFRAVYEGTATLAAAAQTGVNVVAYADPAAGGDAQTLSDTGTNIVGRVYRAEDVHNVHGYTNPVILEGNLGA